MNITESQEFSDLKLAGDRIADRQFTDCTFTECVFEEPVLDGCRFADCRFIGTSIINPRLRNTDLRLASFDHCAIEGVNWSELAPLSSKIPALIGMSDCQLRYCSFAGFSLDRFSFSGTIADSVYERCQLKRASFCGCCLDRTVFESCDLRNADFRKTGGWQIDLKTCRLEGTRFSLPEALGLLDGLGIRIE